MPSFDDIVRGDSELGLFFHLPKARAELADIVFAKVPFKLVIRGDRVRDRSVRASFIGSREIDDAGTKSYPTVDRIRKDIPEVRIRLSSNDATARKQMALAGLGVAILPELMVRSELASGELSELYREERFRFDLHLVARSGRILPRAARVLLDHVKDELGGSAGPERASRKKRCRRGSEEESATSPSSQRTFTVPGVPRSPSP